VQSTHDLERRLGLITTKDMSKSISYLVSYMVISDKSSKGKEDEISIFSDHVHNLDSNELWADMFGRGW
jgi:hypothetical protein